MGIKTSETACLPINTNIKLALSMYGFKCRYIGILRKISNIILYFEEAFIKFKEMMI